MSYAQEQVNNSMAARRQYRGKISTIMFNDPESGYAIFKIKREEDNQPIVAKGHVPNPIAGARIVYEGRWDRDAKRNTPFFNISQAKVDYAAGGKTAIRELLVSDFMPGIGPAMADKIVNHFGTNALDIIENHPNRLKEIYGIGDVMMMRIHDGYMQIAKDQELIAILLPYLSMQKISAIIKKFGSGQMALDEIKENPYAMTVHKSQGSEFKAVVIGVEQFRTRGRFLQRNLLYTAVTRAKKECRIVGEKEAVDAAILANDIEFRNTKLADRLKHFDMEKYEEIHESSVRTKENDWRDEADD